MAFWRDLNDYKLQTEFDRQANIVLHRSYRANRALGRHKIAVEEKWAPQRKPLGAGSFGVVRLEKRLEKDGEPEFRAVKQLRKSDMERMSVDYRKELLALTKFSRSKFVQSQAFVIFLGWFDDDQHVYIAMEYFQRGNLDMYIKDTLTEDDARSVAQQLFEGVRIMHEENFTHRDLKPQNIFVVQHTPHWWVKIGDFGISKRIMTNTTVLHTRVGTPLYLAPEVLGYVDTPEEEDEIYTNAVDVWSLACVVYEMLAARTPFTKWPRELITFCNGGEFPEAHLQARKVSSLGVDFLKKVMIPLPSTRPSAEDSLDSKWFEVEPPEQVIRPQVLSSHLDRTQMSTASFPYGTQLTAASNTWSSLPTMSLPPGHNYNSAASESSKTTLRRKPVDTSSLHSSQDLTSTASTIDSGTTHFSSPNTSTSTLQIPGAGGSLRPRTPEVHAALAKGKHVRSDSADTRLLKTADWDNAVSEATRRDPHHMEQMEDAHRRVEHERVHTAKNAKQPAIPTITSSTVTREDGCARCSGSLTEDDYYLCDICNDTRAGIFAICSNCVAAGKHCDHEDHWLMKSGFNKDGTKKLSSETTIVKTGWSLLPIRDVEAPAMPQPHPEQFNTGRASSYPKKSRTGKAPYDYCYHCGTSFQSDHPPSRHLWEQHETIDGPKSDAPLDYSIPTASTTGWFSVEELRTHKEKMRKMDDELQKVFQEKVDEKVGKMRMSEEELYARHRDMKEPLVRQQQELEEKKLRLESARPLTTEDRGGTSKSTRERWLKWMRD